MPESIALYMDDSYLKQWSAKVIKVQEGKYIVLDKTAFYPKGGGQPYDEGIICKNGEIYNVVYVGKFGGEISHEVDKPGLKEGDEVSCELNWERRYTFMRYHTAAHLISHVLYKEANAKITGNQIELDKTRIDFSIKEYNPELLKAFIDKANQIIQENLEVYTFYMSREKVLDHPELARLAIGLPPNLNPLRIVKIGEIDMQVDGGTHVKFLKEIGTIRFLKSVNKGKSNRRIYFTLE
ncbi:MAG: alanine--tRNA ligase-related protein [Promethearchaeota archaeon]